MRRVKRQRQVDRPTGSGHIGRKALVVFHVTGRQIICVLALEFSKQVMRHLAEDIHQHIQTATVCHADHDLLHALASCALNQRVERRDKALTAFERETLLPDIFGVEITLQALGGRDAVEDVLLLFHGEGTGSAG